MNAGFFDVFHNPHDHYVLAIAERIDIDFDRVLQEPIDEHRLTFGHNESFRHVAFDQRLEENLGALVQHRLHFIENGGIVLQSQGGICG